MPTCSKLMLMLMLMLMPSRYYEICQGLSSDCHESYVTIAIGFFLSDYVSIKIRKYCLDNIKHRHIKIMVNSHWTLLTYSFECFALLFCSQIFKAISDGNIISEIGLNIDLKGESNFRVKFSKYQYLLKSMWFYSSQ